MPDYIIEKESLVNRFISVPKDKGRWMELPITFFLEPAGRVSLAFLHTAYIFTGLHVFIPRRRSRMGILFLPCFGTFYKVPQGLFILLFTSWWDGIFENEEIMAQRNNTLLNKIKGTWSAPSLVCGHSQVQLLEDMHNCTSLKSLMFKKQLTLVAMSLTQPWHLFKG